MSTEARSPVPHAARRGGDGAAFWSVAAISAAAGGLVVLLNVSHGCPVPDAGARSQEAGSADVKPAADPAERALRAWRLA
jgi:hypothetical protein